MEGLAETLDYARPVLGAGVVERVASVFCHCGHVERFGGFDEVAVCVVDRLGGEEAGGVAAPGRGVVALVAAQEQLSVVVDELPELGIGCASGLHRVAVADDGERLLHGFEVRCHLFDAAVLLGHGLFAGFDLGLELLRSTDDTPMTLGRFGFGGGQLRVRLGELDHVLVFVHGFLLEMPEAGVGAPTIAHCCELFKIAGTAPISFAVSGTVATSERRPRAHPPPTAEPPADSSASA